MKNNPYIGPRPYERGDRQNFFGRDRDARDLVGLILAEREVLFYAQSGAGKTSLLNAQVIPTLEDEGFNVLPVTRVGSSLPPSLTDAVVPNIFVLSTLIGLAGADVPIEALPQHTLLSFLREYHLKPPATGKSRPPLLILDQFEELFTTHQDRWKDAAGFFNQVRELLDAEPNLGIVLAMREDHVAEIDPFVRYLPRRLAARYRMERLRREEALEAVIQPARQANCAYAPGVAERLVSDLSRIRIQRRGEAEAEVPGPVVEPVQLQVVCQRLWENLPESGDQLIEWDEISQFGNIDRALTDFYEAAVRQAATSGVSERDLRRWFATQLITPLGTRGLALRGATETAGLPNAAVDLLENRHLIRADVRAGSIWYELSHDRLVEPIEQSNRAWEAARQTPLRIAAQQWQQTKSGGLLYRDKALKDALAWIKNHPTEVEPYEQSFLEASQQAEQARLRRRRVYLAGTLVVAVVLAAMTLLTAFAVAERNRADLKAQEAINAQATAEANARRAEKSERAARARELVAQGQATFEDNPLLGVRLALEGMSLAATVGTDDSQLLSKAARDLSNKGRLLNLGSDVQANESAAGGTFFILKRAFAPDEIRRTRDGALVASLPVSSTDIYLTPDGAMYWLIDNPQTQNSNTYTIELHRTTDNSLVFSSNNVTGHYSWTDRDLTPAGFVVNYPDRPAELRRYADGQLITPLAGPVKGVTFSPDRAATYFQVDYQDGHAPELRYTRDGTLVSSNVFQSVIYGPRPAVLYSVVKYYTGPAELRRTQDGTVITTLPEKSDPSRIKFSSDPQAAIYILPQGEKAAAYRSTDGQLLAELAGPLKSMNSDQPPYRDEAAVYFSPDEAAQYFVAAYAGVPGELRRTVDGSLILTLTGKVSAVNFSRDPAATYFGVAYEDQPGEVRRSADGALIQRLDVKDESPEVSPDLKLFFTRVDYGVEMRRLSDGALLQRYSGNEVATFFGDFSPDGRYFTLYDYKKPRELRRVSDGTLVGRGMESSGIWFSPNPAAPFVILSDGTGSSRILRLVDASVIMTLTGNVEEVVFSTDPAASYFLLNYRNGRSEVWDGRGTPYRLTDLGLGVVGFANRYSYNYQPSFFFDTPDERAVVSYSDGRGFLLDLNWLAAQGGDQAALTGDELRRLTCTGPLATDLWNESALTPYLGSQASQACR